MKCSRLGLVIFTAVLGCGGGLKEPPPADMTSPASSDLATGGGMLCMDSRADPYTLPLTKPSATGAFNVTLMSSSPSPPVIGNDTWIIKVVDKTGAAMNGATITVKPWMPDHGHGTSVKATITPAANDGSYTVTPLYLFMAGFWQLTFTITSPSGTSDTVQFSYCLAE